MDGESGNQPRSPSGDTIRIPSEKLDALIKLMGEVVAGRGRLAGNLSRLRETFRLAGVLLDLLPAAADNAAFPDTALSRTAHELHGALAEAVSALKDDILSQETLTSELMESSLALRTLPLATVFDTFPRTVRDMAQAIGKDIDFTFEGGETELDKVIIEKIGDPLLHMIRNAVDHGIESREERLLAGKAETGSIRLSAWYERGSVTVALRDDGRGIHLQKIRAKALQKKFVDPDTLNALSDAEVTDLIFMPGFSTSELVTDLSGRGVGLDVVRKNIIDELRGSVRIDSREGSGTALYLKLPLTLALSRLLFVSAGDRLYALLADCVEEVLTVSRDDLITVVTKKALRLRNEVIPVEELAQLLGLTDRSGTDSGRLLIAIVAVGSEKLGLAVEAVVDEESVVVKPLPAHLKGIRLVAGVTVRGSHGIVPVLSAAVLCAASREKKFSRPAAQADEIRKELTVLVVDDSISTREIERSIIEAHGYQVVVAGDGLEALEKTRERIFDVIVTDIEMPRLDGFSLTERLRADDRYRHTPIIIVTSREREEDRRRGILVGANAYIVKGAFDQSNLIETIENLVA
ncbi:hybrid sensor histidine kinase/response regulator [bacterium]|nr:hybrid sensor histidine kinase/response regulator [bacterium]